MIVTVTLNPAVDEEFLVPEFRPGNWFRTSHVTRSPGGKGINVSYMLSQAGYQSVAMGFLAGFNGEYIRDALRRLRITTNFVHVPGETRSNVYVVDEVGHVETGIAEAGPYVPEESLARFLSNYDRMLGRAKIVVMGGSLPPGVPQDIYRDLIGRAKTRGIPTLLDAAGPSLMTAIEGGPTFARIDHRFMARVAGVSLTSLDNLIEVVSRVHDYGVEWAVVSYRSYGAVFFTPAGIFLAEYERRGLVSLFGADDALVTGFIIAREENMDVESTIRFATACAWDDSLHVDKGFRSRPEIEELAPRVKVEKLD
ncbi:MAG: 1-phosphofructokinase family hexose kinase [Thermovirgaceae bacterium]|nr:1-phosphofructokinase family hexose kinase [Thermovirgaceae bacterium]